MTHLTFYKQKPKAVTKMQKDELEGKEEVIFQHKQKELSLLGGAVTFLDTLPEMISKILM